MPLRSVERTLLNSDLPAEATDEPRTAYCSAVSPLPQQATTASHNRLTSVG